jgi:hypothetical protein
VRPDESCIVKRIKPDEPQGVHRDAKEDEIQFDHNHDGIDRRGFLKCMAWAGTGAFCVMQGGVLKSYGLSRIEALDPPTMKGELSFRASATATWALAS